METGIERRDVATRLKQPHPTVSNLKISNL